MKDTLSQPSDVLGFLMNPAVQKEIRRGRPKFDRTELVLQILDAWPDGQKGFAREIYQEFKAAKPGSATKPLIIRLITELISKETDRMQVRPVADMTEAQLAAVIRGVAPALARIEGDDDA